MITLTEILTYFNDKVTLIRGQLQLILKSTGPVKINSHVES